MASRSDATAAVFKKRENVQNVNDTFDTFELLAIIIVNEKIAVSAPHGFITNE